MVNLTEILYCPITHLKLDPLDTDRLATINRAIKDGKIKDINGNEVNKEIEDGLVREDNLILYEIRSGIPILLPDSGIDLSSFKVDQK